jgi:hypothetical protein
VRTAAALLLLLSYLDGSRPPFQTVQHFDLTFLTHKEALDLNGRRIVCRVDLDSRPNERGGYTINDCASLDDTYRTVWLRRGQQVEDTMIVEAMLRHATSHQGRASTASGSIAWWARRGSNISSKKCGRSTDRTSRRWGDPSSKGSRGLGLGWLRDSPKVGSAPFGESRPLGVFSSCRAESAGQIENLQPFGRLDAPVIA